MDTKPSRKTIWRRPDGSPLACDEKIKMLDENLEEIRQVCQDALEDALLMGCDERQVRAALDEVLCALHNPYEGKE